MNTRIGHTPFVNQSKSCEELKAEFLRWRQLEADERMALLRSGKSGSIAWEGCQVRNKSIQDAEMLYELRMEIDRG